MSIFFDILIALIFLAILFKDWFKGFFKSVLSLGRLVLTVILTILLGPVVSEWIDNRFIHPPVFNAVHEKLAAMAAEAGENVSSFFDQIGDKYSSVVDPAALEGQSASATEKLDTLVEQYAQSISASISIVIATIIGYILLFIVCFVLLTVAIWLLGKVVKLPVIRKVDKLLGLLLGIIGGYLTASLVATLIYAILMATGDLSAYEASYVFRFFYDFNLFKTIIPQVIV